MILRNDDELPPLTPNQQAEILALAAKLQAEAATTREFLRAAEESGIESQHLEEAFRRVVRPQPTPVRVSAPEVPYGLSTLLLAGVLVACVPFPFLAVPLLVGLLIALVPCSSGRSRPVVVRFVLGTFLLVDAAVGTIFAIQRGFSFNLPSDASALFAVLCLQAVLALAAVELAGRACCLSARLARRKPQSL